MAPIKGALAVAALVATVLTASCANTQVPTGTSTDRAALCIQGITAARKAATALLRAEKISLEKDQQIQDSLNAAVPGCAELAKEVTP